MELKHFCRTCKGKRNHKSLFSKKTSSDYEEERFNWHEDFEIIECLGCETISFLKVYTDDNMAETNDEGKWVYYSDYEVYPNIIEDIEPILHTHFLPQAIRNIYFEAVQAYKVNAFILTAGGLRAIIEALCNHLDIKKGTLSSRIDLLHKKSYLTLSESKRLHSIRFLGNDALHEIEPPKKHILILLFEIINHLLLNLFINDKKIEGHLDTIIDNYFEFLIHIKCRTNHVFINKESTLLQILGKSIRRFSKENIVEFEKRLIEEIKNNTLDFIELIEERPSNSTYKIIRIEKEFPF